MRFKLDYYQLFCYMHFISFHFSSVQLSPFPFNPKVHPKQFFVLQFLLARLSGCALRLAAFV